MSPNRMLADYIRQHGPVRAVRVSSAQARGRAKQYSYWGAARYELRLARDGYVIAVALERAPAARRARHLAAADASALAAREGRILCQAIGRLTEGQAEEVLSLLRQERRAA